MERHRIKRVPVTEGNRVIGVVSRADLLRALVVAERREPPMAPTTARSARRSWTRWTSSPGRR